MPKSASDGQWVQVLGGLLKDVDARDRLAAQAVAVREMYAPQVLQQRLLQALEGVIQARWSTGDAPRSPFAKIR